MKRLNAGWAIGFNVVTSARNCVLVAGGHVAGQLFESICF